MVHPLLYFIFCFVFYLCYSFGVGGRWLHSRFSYISVVFHKRNLCVNIVLNIRYGALVDSNRVTEGREMALGHVIINVNIKVTESILMEFGVFL